MRFAISRSNGGPALLDGAKRFATVLSAQVKLKVEIAVSYDYAALLRALLGGGAELAWMPPLIHARAAKAGAQLIAVSERGGRLGYRSAIVVRQDSPYRRVSQLKAVRAAWVDRASASGYLFPRLHLLAAGLKPEEAFASERFFGSATNACRAVVNAEADLAAVFLSAADTIVAAQREIDETFHLGGSLRVLEMTSRIPPDGFVTAPGVDPAIQKTVRTALLALHEHADGRDALSTLLQAERLAPVADDIVRDLARLLAHAELTEGRKA